MFVSHFKVRSAVKEKDIKLVNKEENKTCFYVVQEPKE